MQRKLYHAFFSSRQCILSSSSQVVCPTSLSSKTCSLSRNVLLSKALPRPRIIVPRLHSTTTTNDNGGHKEEYLEKDPSTQQSSSSTPLLFEDLQELNPTTKATVQAMDITEMTEIQAKTWRAILNGRDIVGRSETGSGKTISFLLPSIERILRSSPPSTGDSIQMLVIAPTRELANQIDASAKMLTSGQPILCQAFHGGYPKARDLQQLRDGVDARHQCGRRCIANRFGHGGGW